jgi:hypothetical protein
MVMSERPPTETWDSLSSQIQQLVERYERDRQVPEVPKWILPPASCDFLQDIATLLPRPMVAFEFGSGRSTSTLRAISDETISMESSADWLEQTEANGARKRPGDQSVIVPLRRCWNRLRLIESFDLTSNDHMLESLQRSRLILIDSPPNPAKREHALFTTLTHAPVGAVIVLDDLEVRAVRRFSLRLARQNADAFEFWTVAIDHQLGVFLKKRAQRLRSFPSAREFVGTWMRV